MILIRIYCTCPPWINCLWCLRNLFVQTLWFLHLFCHPLILSNLHTYCIGYYPVHPVVLLDVSSCVVDSFILLDSFTYIYAAWFSFIGFLIISHTAGHLLMTSFCLTFSTTYHPILCHPTSCWTSQNSWRNYYLAWNLHGICLTLCWHCLTHALYHQEQLTGTQASHEHTVSLSATASLPQPLTITSFLRLSTMS